MDLGQLITRLAGEHPDQVVPIGFANPHSYRGFYHELAFEPAPTVTVGAMVEAARSAVGRTFTGYKGGDYTMTAYTPVWLAAYGATGEGIGPILLDYMLGAIQPTPTAAPVESHKPLSDTGGQPGEGRQLDILVAERVLGQRVTWLHNAARPPTPWLLHGAEVSNTVQSTTAGWTRGITDNGVEMYHRGACLVPCYSTDVAAAWQVVEAIRARGFHLDIGSTVRGSSEDLRAGVKHGQWEVGVRSLPTVVRRDTFPEAVCRCALALGERPEWTERRTVTLGANQ